MVSLATPLSRKPSSRKPSSRKPRRTGAKLARFVRRVVGYQKAHPSISFAEIARHFRISPYYAGMIFRRAGCKTPFPPRTEKPPQIGMHSGITADQLVQTFQQMGSSKRVAERWGLTRSYVNQVLLAAGCRTKRQPRPYDLQKAIARYRSGDPIYEIATENKIGHKRLRRDLFDAGETIRHKTAWLKGWHAERRDAVKKAWRPADWDEKPIEWRIIGTELLSRESYMSNEELAGRLDTSRIKMCPYAATWSIALARSDGAAIKLVSKVRKWVNRPGRTPAEK
jgi:hypothetical protein